MPVARTLSKPLKKEKGRGEKSVLRYILFFFFFYVPQLYLLGFTILDETFAYLTVFFPTIEVVTFRLRG